ncbi:MAG TPA: response regulator [Burkholderiales bacterium]|jgi:two-component system chemotaxis sensor kinase CheA
MARDPYKYFRIEAAELLEQLGAGLLELEKGAAAPELTARLLRLMHTLKGAARVVKQVEISESAHQMETVLAPFRESSVALPRGDVARLIELLDTMGARLAGLAAPAPEEAGQGGPKPADVKPAAMPARAAQPAPEEARTLRADLSEMDALLDGVAETQAQVKALRHPLEVLGRARALAGLLEQQQARGPAANAAAAESARALAAELADTLGALEAEFGTAAERVERELQVLHGAVEQLRLVPVSALFAPLRRAVRDAAQTLGREAAFEARGGEVRLDAHVLDVLQGALQQVVRNAVAHGIEAPAQREAAGKPPAGRVVLEVARRGQRVAFSCTDDGRGVDLEAVRRAAQRRGLARAEIDGLDAGGLLRLLLRGGISTAGVVTEVAGRGIGLDLARAAAESLGGEIAVRTAAGQGTTIELLVPLSVAAVDAVTVEAGGMVANIPLDKVNCTLRVAQADLAEDAQGQAMVHEGKVIPFAPLARLLRKNQAPRDPRHWAAVVVEGSAGTAAFGVDRLLGTANVVIRALPEMAPPSLLAAGTAMDAEGNPRLVLDIDGLIEALARLAPVGAPAAAARRAILVVDDSLTTRMLEKSILESAGYEVHLTASAEEGLEAARAGDYALFLVDVEMPGMDGFAFVEQVRADARLSATPAIMVTSRNAPEDFERGRQAGAQGHIVKSEFDQKDFLERIRRLVA